MSVLRHAIVGSGMVPPRPLRVFFTPWMVLFSVGHLFPGMRRGIVRLFCLECWKMLRLLRLKRRKMIRLLLQRRK